MGTQRPGGRTARTRSGVIAATLELLQEEGFVGLTFDGVARRAGVHRTTIHRRWPNRAALVADALLAISADEVAVPDTGRVRADLRRFAFDVRDAISTPLARSIVSTLADPHAGPAARDASRRFWDARFAATSGIVERAVTRGEFPDRADPRFVIEALGGPIWFRTFVVGDVCDDEFVERLVETVVAGVKGDTK